MDENSKSGMEPVAGSDGGNFVRRRLGRGLSALLGSGPGDEPHADGDAAVTGGGHADTNQIHVELIERNPYQPRRDFNQDSLNELVESIRQHGVLQPLLLRPHGGVYQLIAGERRWLAAKLAGIETVPCRVLELEDRAMCEAALEENLKRKDLNVLEKAQAFQDYMHRFNASLEDLARQLSMNRSSVCNFLRLLDLTDFVKTALLAERITFGHARAVLSLTADGQMALCQRIEAESLSVRQTEAAVREMLKQQQEAGPETISFEQAAKAASRQPSNHVRAVQEQLQNLLGLPVEIKLAGKEKGKFVISFANNDEFERILGQLRRAA